MLGDRSYMRDSAYRQPRWSTTVILMVVLTACFAFQEINRTYLAFPLEYYGALSTGGIARGWVWQLLTFQFLHSGLWHLAMNLLGLWFFGRAVEDRLGTRNFLKIYFSSGFAGGVLQVLLGFAFSQHFGSTSVVGASAGIMGLLAAFAMLEPDGEILLFFVLSVKARILLYVLIGMAVFFTIVPSEPGVAHAAHLGGLLVGAGYIRFQLYSSWQITDWEPLRTFRRRRELVKVASMKPAQWRKPRTTEPEELPPGEFISKEVDPILDKISAHGLHSLTEKERRILEEARAKIGRR